MTLTKERPLVLGHHGPGYDIVVAPEIADGQVIYVARHPALPRCFSQGDTPADAIASLDEVREAFLADLAESGEPSTNPVDDPSVQVLELGRQDREDPLVISWKVNKSFDG